MSATLTPSTSAGSSQAVAHETTLIAWMRQHTVISFFVIAFGLSWAVWIPMALAGARVQEGQVWPTHVAGLLGPIAAAFIMAAVVAGPTGVCALMRRMVQWRVAGRWYLVALSPLALYAGAVLALEAVGQGWPDLTELGTFSGLPLVAFPVMWLLLLVATYAEETGWRGFAVQEMLKTRNLLPTAVVVGLL